MLEKIDGEIVWVEKPGFDGEVSISISCLDLGI